MKKFLCVFALLAVVTFCGNRAFAQLPNGSFASDFSLVDIDGTTHVLYDYLDADKPVIIDVSAVWCGPCWSYHTGGTLETAYNSWDTPGTGELKVLWIEGDQNPLACLQGTGCSTQGDWTAGTSFPMILTVAPNGASVVSDLQIGYFPTIYVICPDRVVTEAGQVGATALRAVCTSCPAFPTTTNDAKAYSVEDPITSSCSANITPKVTIQNYGSANLVSLILTSKVDGVVVGSPYTWTGNLARFEHTEITMPIMNGIADGSHTYSVVTSLPNGVADDNAVNDTKSSNFSVFSSGANVLVNILTDSYPTEVSWKIFNQGTSTVVAQKTSFISGTNNTSVCLDYQCYTFTIYDAYGDGMLSPGKVLITFAGDTLVYFLGTSYTNSKSVDFCVQQSSIGETAAISALSVYPNPFTNKTTIAVNLSESQDVQIDVFNVLGENVSNIAKSVLSAGDHKFELNAENLKDGIYIVRMTVGDRIMTKRIDLIR